MIKTNISKAELKALAEKILSAKSEEESDQAYHEFNKHFTHPDTANLFFWPENYDQRNDIPKISEYDPTIEEVIEIGEKHKPIEQGPILL